MAQRDQDSQQKPRGAQLPFGSLFKAVLHETGSSKTLSGPPFRPEKLRVQLLRPLIRPKLISSGAHKYPYEAGAICLRLPRVQQNVQIKFKTMCAQAEALPGFKENMQK